jgi:polyhydroxybutyrate depolymerase
MVLFHFFQRFVRLVVLVLVVFLACMCTPARPQSTDENSLEFDELRRTYQLFIPASYDGSKAVPLVVALHGGYGNGQKMSDLTNFSSVAKREGFIVVYPDGYQISWNDGRGTTAAAQQSINDVGFISSLIDKLSSDYKIIPEQIYVTGFSNGGYLSYRLACELSEKIAAVAPVGANMAETVAATCAPKRAIPVLQMNGTSDPLTPYEGGAPRGSPVLSAEKSVAYWATKNSCREASSTPLPDTARDDTTVTLTSYSGCLANVQLYTVNGGGHTWPSGLQYLPERRIGKTSQDINASEVIWKFFAEHPVR